MMDLKEQPAEHPAQDETIIANMIILSYAALGLTPIVVPPLTIDRRCRPSACPSQQVTDLDYLQQMARRYGYVFYVDPGTGAADQHRLLGAAAAPSVPQKALTVNLGAETNVDPISFSLQLAWRRPSSTARCRTGGPTGRCRCGRSPAPACRCWPQPAWLAQQPTCAAASSGRAASTWPRPTRGRRA